MQDCRSCKTPKDCAGHFYAVKTELGKIDVAWYHYGEVRWCVFQVLWILENSEALREGIWPPSPDGSSYIDPKIKTGYGSEAYFVKPVAIIAEVERRIKRTGVHGKLLKAEVQAGIELSAESRSALMYAKGWRRKRMAYGAWKKQRRYKSSEKALL